MDVETWPPAGLTIQNENLRLRLPDAAEMSQITRDAGAESYDPSVPFLTFPDDDAPARRRRTAQAFWAMLGSWRTDRWSLMLGATVDGQLVGLHNIRAEDFAVRGEVTTGSWVRSADHGRGFGSLMAAAALHLAFEGLGAADAVCTIRVDNIASRRVAEKVGYEPDGIERSAVNGELAEFNRYRLPASRWRRLHSWPVSITGLAACRDMFGWYRGT